MRLNELTKHPNQMNKEELERYMFRLLENMNEELDSINDQYRKENGSGNRIPNMAIPPKHSPAV